LPVYLLRYGEIGVKSAIVRSRFERKLGDNLLALLSARGAKGGIEREWGRLRLRCDDDAAASDALSHLFGLVSWSRVTELPADPSALKEHAALRAGALLGAGTRFAIRARRTGEHAFTSAQVAGEIGAAVLARVPAARVDLSAPEREFFFEIRDERAYYYESVEPGPGGLPAGVEGVAAAAVGDLRGACAAWMALRRGCDVLALPVPPGGDDSIAALRAWHPPLRVLPAAGDDPLEWRSIASRHGASAVFVGASLEQAVALPAGDPPFLAPLVALRDSDVARLSAVVRGQLPPYAVAREVLA